MTSQLVIFRAFLLIFFYCSPDPRSEFFPHKSTNKKIGLAIILMGKRELVALLNLSSWCLVMVERLFLEVRRGCLQFVIVVFPDHTHLLFLSEWIHNHNLCGYLAHTDELVDIAEIPKYHFFQTCLNNCYLHSFFGVTVSILVTCKQIFRLMV